MLKTRRARVFYRCPVCKLEGSRRELQRHAVSTGHPTASKVTVLPTASRSDMMQQVSWRAARKGMTTEEFKKGQYRKMRQYQKKQRAIIRELFLRCPEWHRWLPVGTAEGIRIFYCKQCKAHRGVRPGKAPSGTVI